MPVRKSVGSNPTGVIIFCRIRFAIYECILNKIKVHTYVHTNRNVRNKFRSYFIYCRSHKYSLFGPCGDANINKSFHVYLLPSKVHGM